MAETTTARPRPAPAPAAPRPEPPRRPCTRRGCPGTFLPAGRPGWERLQCCPACGRMACP